MKRRSVIKAIVAAPIFFTGTPNVAHAVPPPLIAALGFAVSFIFRRYVVGPFMLFLARLWPSLFASETRKYFISALLMFGFDQAKAAVLAEHAEVNGAENVATHGKAMETDIEITNKKQTPLELTGLKVQLVDVAQNIVELESTASWGLVIPPTGTMTRKIVASNFPRPGLKQWYLVNAEGTLSVSKPFLVAA